MKAEDLVRQQVETIRKHGALKVVGQVCANDLQQGVAMLGEYRDLAPHMKVFTLDEITFTFYDDRKYSDASDIVWSEEVPLKALVDFTPLMGLFEDTHEHLPAFDIIDAELQLKGDAYYPIKKAMCYLVESLRQPTYKFPVGSEEGDNRMNILEMVSGGRGKGQQRKLVQQYNSGEYQRVPVFQPTRTHAEQLIGKIVHSKKETREERGFFGYKGLIVDEGQTFVCEENPMFAALMLDFRNAMEVYGKNTVEKKLTAENLMRYDPETRFLFLMHPVKLPALFFDHGTARRLLAFKIDVQPIPMSASFASLITPKPVKRMGDYINNTYEVGAPVFVDESIAELVEWIAVFANFVLKNPSQRIRALGQRNFTSLKLHFIRHVAILSMLRKEFSVRPETVALACRDTVQFLLSTYELFANESSLNLSRDVWKTADPLAAMVFEWMHYNKALSEAETPLSIAEVERKIAEVYGVQDRQAEGRFAAFVEAGLIGRKKGPHVSKAWLAFVPQIDSGVEFDVSNIPELTEFLKSKGEQYGWDRRNRRTTQTPPSNESHGALRVIESINFANIKSEKVYPTSAPIAPKERPDSKTILESQPTPEPPQEKPAHYCYKCAGAATHDWPGLGWVCSNHIPKSNDQGYYSDEQ